MTVHASDLAAVTQPVSTARGLPNPFYVDPAVFELPAGKTEIDVWIENPGEGRVLATVNSTRGDIGVRGPL